MLNMIEMKREEDFNVDLFLLIFDTYGTSILAFLGIVINIHGCCKLLSRSERKTMLFHYIPSTAFLHPGLLEGQDLLFQRGGQVWRRPGRGLRGGPGSGRGGQEREHRPQGRARTLHHDALLLCLQVDPHQRGHLFFSTQAGETLQGHPRQ